MNKLAIIGDLHSNLDALIEVTNEPDVSAVLCVGDLGIFMDRKSADYDKKAIKHTGQKILEHIQMIEHGSFPIMNIPVYAIKGNHDDYEHMYGRFFFEHNIHYLPQACMLNIKNLRIAALGGIYSPVKINIDPKNLRGRARRFYTQSEIDMLKKAKSCDILITHQAARNVLPTENHRDDGSAVLEELLISLKPTYYIHGHHHHNYTSTYNNTKVIGLGKFYNKDNAKVYFNTETKELI